MTTIHYICDAGQPNNNVGGWYGEAYASYLCVETGKITKIKLGKISINRAELKAIIHILWTIWRKYGVMTKYLSLHIKTDSKTAILASRRKKAPKMKDKSQIPFVIKERQVYRQLKNQFASVELQWVPREEIVPVLGH